MDKVYRGTWVAGFPATRSFCRERRCGYRYNLHPALQGSGGKNCYSDNGGSLCLRTQSEKVLAPGDRDHILSGVFNQFLSALTEPVE